MMSVRGGVHIWALCVLTLEGCTPDRCKVMSDELSMVARVVDNGVTVRAAVDFATGERGELSVPWERCENDRVQINGETAMETVESEQVEYSLTLDVGAATAFEFRLAREDFDPVVATVELPPTFEVVEPAPGQPISRGADVTIRWQPPNPGGEMQIELAEEVGAGVCIVAETEGHEYKRPGGIRVEDDGEWLVPATAIGGDPQADCDARYVLNRFAQGDYPSALDPGGFIEAEVLRTIVFTSTP
jgi:hypothetical protein